MGYGLALLSWLSILFILSILSTSGCAQNTEAASAQPTIQQMQPVSDQAAQGSKSDVRVWIFNAPADNAVPGEPGMVLNLGAAGERPSVAETASEEAGNRVRDTRAGYVQSGFTLNIHTGGSTTGAQATGGLSGQTSTPGATISQTPHQEPKASVTVPIAVGMPGSAPQATGTGTVEGNASSTPVQTAELRTAMLKAAAGEFGPLAAIFEALFGEKLPTSQP